ncbi:hypothetical protein PC129_g122 [Phytophthora cactorum]|uniref:Uncharacterized protein n=1 Tax=Phytophthora cactorum TaxID=29920 RepID=A0A329T302_9STRA|nr:hypothetical protein Pcac1_g202 [Phytophthora cactorum]KAG2820935.1 hypothetical protein PC112_g11570 [Phytophthora cactorum]KAG2848389.1 hypothetical protein PC111_g418 [Phytophthora cactorum]KAG2868789.1 hypothetical protein PC113_g765 [Phytophthora cactorum]KAG2934401.1 hypothetical protein PC114_g965 [Phytophthora cactorum]
MTFKGLGLLSKRILSVEAFRRERLERSRVAHLTPPLSKAIPVPLYPGESQQQYHYKFEQWLVKKSVRLDSIRSDPKRERKLWLAFAFLRSNPPSMERQERQRVQKRSIDEEYEAFYQRSASQSIKRLRRDRSIDSDRSASRGKQPPTSRIEARREHRSTSSSHRDDEEMAYATHSHSNARPIDRRDEILNSCQMPPRPQNATLPASQPSADKPFQPRNRAEILASRVLSMDEYLREMKGPKQNRRPNGKLAKIPVPLFPGETMDEYEQEFGRWLHNRQTSVLLLQYKPLKERVYRHQFAYQRFLKKTTPTSSKDPDFQTRRQSPISKAKDDLHEANESSGSRDEATTFSKVYPPIHSNPTVSPPNEAPEHEAAERTSHHTSCALSRSSTNKGDHAESGSGHSDTNTPKVSTQAPTASSQKAIQVAQGPAEMKVAKREKEEAVNTQSVIADTTAEDSTTEALPVLKSDGASDTKKADAPIEEKVPSWALQLMSSVQKLEAKVTQLQRQVDACPCCQGRFSGGVQPEAADPARKFEPPQHLQLSTKPTTLSDGDKNESKCKDIQAKSEALSKSGAEAFHDVPVHLPTTKESKNVDERKEKVAEKQSTCEDIHREATHILARAVQARVHEDPKKHQLTEAYDHLNEQISMNETALDDALDYIKAIKDVDEAIAMEQHSQIMELVVSINKEKERRASALAALIIYNFINKQDTLVSLLEEEPPGEGRSKTNHDELGALFSQIEQKDIVLETLEMHLNEQLQWVIAPPPCVSEADKALRFKALRKMSKRLVKEQATKEQLEHKRDDVVTSFLQDDKEIRKLVKESLTKNRAVGVWKEDGLRT